MNKPTIDTYKNELDAFFKALAERGDFFVRGALVIIFTETERIEDGGMVESQIAVSSMGEKLTDEISSRILAHGLEAIIEDLNKIGEIAFIENVAVVRKAPATKQ